MSTNIQKQDWRYAKGGGAINVSIDATDQLAEVERMLGDMKKKAPGTLRNAVNATARKMRTQLHQQAKKAYVTKEYNYKNEMEIRKASTSTLTARIRTSGERTALSKHKVSPERLAHGKGRPKQYKAKVLRQSTLTVMQDGDLKSFLVRFKSGHLALVQRNPKEEYDNPDERIKQYGLGADLSRIVEKRTLSIAEMLGSSKVYGVVEPEMGDLLQTEIERFVGNAIKKGAKK